MSALDDMDRVVQENHDRAQARTCYQCPQEHTYTSLPSSCRFEPCVSWTRVRALLADIPTVDNPGENV